MFTILIVEDSKEILDLMVLHLEDKYNLIKAEDGINAIKIAKKEKIDLLILYQYHEIPQTGNRRPYHGL